MGRRALRTPRPQAAIRVRPMSRRASFQRAGPIATGPDLVKAHLEKQKFFDRKRGQSLPEPEMIDFSTSCTRLQKAILQRLEAGSECRETLRIVKNIYVSFRSPQLLIH